MVIYPGNHAKTTNWAQSVHLSFIFNIGRANICRGSVSKLGTKASNGVPSKPSKSRRWRLSLSWRFLVDGCGTFKQNGLWNLRQKGAILMVCRGARTDTDTCEVPSSRCDTSAYSKAFSEALGRHPYTSGCLARITDNHGEPLKLNGFTPVLDGKVTLPRWLWRINGPKFSSSWLRAVHMLNLGDKTVLGKSSSDLDGINWSIGEIRNIRTWLCPCSHEKCKKHGWPFRSEVYEIANGSDRLN